MLSRAEKGKRGRCEPIRSRQHVSAAPAAERVREDGCDRGVPVGEVPFAGFEAGIQAPGSGIYTTLSNGHLCPRRQRAHVRARGAGRESGDRRKRMEKTPENQYVLSIHT